VLRRPHFRRTGDELFFLISNRPHTKLSVKELEFWTALADEPTVEKLLQLFPHAAEQILSRFLELELCEIAETNYRSNRRRILVFEPHSDDAVLSVGGTMWLRRHDCEFILVTVGSRSNFTSYYELDRDYFDVEQISALREAEGTLFSRLIGGQYRVLDLPEAALRYQDGTWSLEWFRRHRYSVSAFIAHHAGASELREWTRAIRNVLREYRASEVWFPLGSPHTDHQLTRDAALFLMRAEPALFNDCDVSFYEDVPYAARYPTFTRTIVDALTRSGLNLVPEIVPIGTVLPDKLHLVSTYGSQFKIEAMRAEILASATLAGGDKPAERLWHVANVAKFEGSDAIRADAPVVLRTAKQLTPWLKRHRKAKRIRLLLLVPAGRWAEDVKYLLDTFPEAQIEAYVAPAAMAEVAAFASPRCRILPCDAGPRAWAILALRLMFMRPAPTLFIAGEKRLREARVLSALWFRSDAIVLPAMDHLVSALRQLAPTRT